MPRGAGRLDVKRVNANTMERACRDPANLRVGATNDPLSRARQYEQHGANGAFFVGQFLYCEARNARKTEQHLLDVSRQHGRGRLNVQQRSNYQDVPAYVYIIVGRILQMDAYGRVLPPRQPDCCGCSVM